MKHLKLLIGFLLMSNLTTAQFQTCNSPTEKNLWDVFFIDSNVGIAVGDSGVIVRSTDGGLNWDIVLSNDTVDFKKVNFFDSLNGIAIGTDMYKTSDGGQTWTDQNLPNSFTDIAILNDSSCIISGYPTTILKSVDKGLTWDTLISQNGNIASGLLSFIDNNIGYCSFGFSTETLKTVDGGKNWTLITAPTSQITPTVLEAMSFVSEGIGFKGGWYNPHLQKTTDGANNWNFVNYNDSLTYGQLYDFHIEKNQPYSYCACGWYGQIFKSIDGGNNWSELNSGLSNTTSLYGIFFINDLTGWAVGSKGTIIKTTNGGGVVGTNKIEKNHNLKIFPNPTKGNIQIEVLDELDIKAIKVYDSLGRNIAIPPSQNLVELNSCEKGIYFLAIETDKGTYVEKIIKE